VAPRNRVQQRAGRAEHARVLVSAAWPLLPATEVHFAKERDSYIHTFVFGSASGNDRAGTVQSLCNVDVVLTTYGVVSREYGRLPPGVFKGADGADSDDAAAMDMDLLASQQAQLNGTIFGVHFHRVVLDEAHMIKSRTTAVARGRHAMAVDNGVCAVDANPCCVVPTRRLRS